MEISSIAPFLDYHDRIRERTDRLVTLVPSDRLEWTYAPGKYSCGDLIRHIAAIERYMYLPTILENTSRYTGCGTELASGYDEVMDLYRDLRADTRTLLHQLSNEDLQKKCITPAGIPVTVWKWLRAMIEHEAHHRGQLYQYLGMFGISTPPIFGMTAEEVAAAAGKSAHR